MAQPDSPPHGGPPDPNATFKPYVPASESPPEFTVSSVLLGILFGVFFGAVTVYLALKVGLTVSASIPIAVLSIVIYKVLARVTGKSSILQNNIVQTTGSAGESIAAGVVFTLPALVFLGFEPSYWRIVSVALAGGWLGVLFMIPLRRYLIVKEHGVLKYPEGTACAEVLIAGERGGSLGLRVLQGLGIGFAYSWFMKGFGLWNDTPDYKFGKWYQGGSVSGEITPELLGVGYIIGYRISAIMVAGGVLTYLVFIPLISYLGQFMPDVVIFPSTVPISKMDPAAIRGAYVRYIGAGAVATGGILNVIRALPVIVDSFRSSVAEMRAPKGGPHPYRDSGAPVAEGRARTDRDMPIQLVAGGSFAIVVFLWLTLTFAINPGHAIANAFAAVLMVVFGFLFVTVSSRLVGEIGSSSNPISGMTIATLIITCLLFVALGWTGDVYAPIALSIGAIVCINAANAGNTSQDLKTGYIVGATPIYQQIGLAIGVITSAFVIGWTVLYLHKVFTIGSAAVAAPQATLMATLIQGLLSQNLPWGLVLVGMFISVTLELCGIHSLSFAVGSYLPVATTAPIFVGGLVRWFVERKTGETSESDISSGTLFSSGLIAGGSLAGILFAVLVGTGAIDPFQAVGNAVAFLHGEDAMGQILGSAFFLGLAVILARAAQRKLE